MRKILLLFIFSALCIGAFAQMNYQCIILDNNDDPVASTAIGVRASIRLNASNGAISYQETHTPTTDEFGRMNVVIGNGTPTIGTYGAVPRTGTHFLEIEIDLSGGTSYTSLATTEIHPAFKTDEVDPVFDASPAATITAVDISNWNSASGGSVVELNSSNYSSATITNNDVVDIQDIITLTANFSSMNDDRLLITGGGFQGTGTQTVNLGSFSTVTNVYFKDVLLSGSYINFVNCYFEGAIRMPSNSSITGGRIFNGNIQTNVSLRNITSCEIDNTTVPRVENITHCRIENSTIGNTTYEPQLISNSDLDDCVIYMDGEFIGNNCASVTLQVNNGADMVIIEGNEFDENDASSSYIIVINRTSSSAKNLVKIANNIFWGDTSSSKHIQVNGTYSNGSYDSIVHIDGNSFTKGSQVIENNATGVDFVVSNNVLNSLPSIGISAGGGVYLIDNTIIP